MNYTQSELQGTEAEKLYKQVAMNNGYLIIDATVHENKNKHIDFIVKKEKDTNNESFTVDVKSLKKINRSDKNIDDSLICIELQNVSGGTGWLYGKEDKLAFFIQEGICTISRLDLLNLFNTLNIDLNVKSMQSTKNKKVHTIYDRSQWRMKYDQSKFNNDRFIYITKAELLSLKHTIWSIE